MSSVNRKTFKNSRPCFTTLQCLQTLWEVQDPTHNVKGEIPDVVVWSYMAWYFT